jgi:DNA invertase Pin-like site-specific DNA recombinase
MSNPLRFAILCRVSTELQEKDGLSLEAQENTLTNCVKLLGGMIAKKYIGQEHATSGYSRPILEKLLDDANKVHPSFDAVIIYDWTRWARDSETSALALGILKKQNIKLYVQTQEYDLNNPEIEFTATVLTSAGRLQAALTKNKTMESKVLMARRGWPITNPPYGRRTTNDNKKEEAKWEVIPECQQLAERIYDLYVNQGHHLEKIGDILEMSKAQVRNIVIKYSGDEWKQQIKFGKFNEVIITKIPPLLTEEQRQRIKQQSANNKKFESRKYEYSLSSYIKCGVCGLTYVGQTSTARKTSHSKSYYGYYVHSRHSRTEICFKHISVEVIESAVFYALNQLLRSTHNINKAIKSAFANTDKKKEETNEKLAFLISQKDKLNKEKSRLINHVQKGTLTDEEIMNNMIDIRKKIDNIECEIKYNEKVLKSLDVSIPDDIAQRIKKHINILTNEEGYDLSDWSYDNRKKLIKWFFGNNKNNGILIRRDLNKNIFFQIKGAIGGIIIGVAEKHTVGTTILGLNEINQNFDVLSTNDDFRNIVNDLYTDDEIQVFDVNTQVFPSTTA